MRLTALAMVAAACLSICSAATAAPVYYVSPNGNDANSGLSPNSPWKTAAKVNDTPFDPGTQILFERNGHWREQLLASSHGTAAAPIVYGAYGSGAKPKFWGSDVLNNASFAPLPGSSSVFTTSFGTPVNSVLVNHQFARGADHIQPAATPQQKIELVKSTPNTWFHHEGKLYLNTGGVNPATDSRQYTAAVRDDLVASLYRNHVTFQDLATDESAKYGAGYGFRAQNTTGVKFINTEAYRAGKHHYGAINSGDFKGINVYGASMMPDQGYGGASGIASFTDGNHFTGHDHEWRGMKFEDLGGDGSYPAFVLHGSGLRNVLVKDLVAKGGGAFIATESAQTRVRIEGGRIDNSTIDLYSANAVVDGVELVGPKAAINATGENNTIQNNVLRGFAPNWWMGLSGAIENSGKGNIFRFNTILLSGDRSGPWGGAIAVLNGATDTQVYGNLFGDADPLLMFGSLAELDSHDNFFAPGSRFLLDNGSFSATLAQWKARGLDLDALVGDPMFADRLAGDLSLLPGSPVIDRFDLLGLIPLADILGLDRPQGVFGDLGAYERLHGAADINDDGRVDIADYLKIDRGLARKLQGRANGDLNLDGVINGTDYMMLDVAYIQQFQDAGAAAPSSVPGSALPEPQALALIALSAALVARRHRGPSSRAGDSTTPEDSFTADKSGSISCSSRGARRRERTNL